MRHIRRKGEKILFVGTYVPETCGIATFTKDLVDAVKQNNGDHEYSCLAVDRAGRDYSASGDVCCTMRRDFLPDYVIRSLQINGNGFTLLNVQHEYGIYGGNDGEYLLSFLENIDVPVITTLHTLSLTPSRREREILQQVCRLSRGVVVMSRTAAALLESIYGVKDDRVHVIHHGVPDVSSFKGDGEEIVQRGLKGKKIISTFGLLSKGKGIEVVIQAMPEILKAHPDTVYLVVGKTHPAVHAEEGEAYRETLVRLCDRLGVSHAVRFVNEYITLEQIVHYLKITDIYITPYLNPNQIVSGTLAYALGCGKAIISTPYLYAKEMLSHGRGMLVPYQNADAVAREVISAFSHPGKIREHGQRALSAGRKMTWKKVGKEYHRVYEHVLARDRWLSPPPVRETHKMPLYDMRSERYPRSLPVM